MTIYVEFYGVPRQRAGTDRIPVLSGRDEVTLRDVWGELSRLCPAWATECLERGKLRDSFSANVDGNRFVREPDTIIKAGQSLLIMSADAGG